MAIPDVVLVRLGSGDVSVVGSIATKTLLEAVEFEPWGRKSPNPFELSGYLYGKFLGLRDPATTPDFVYTGPNEMVEFCEAVKKWYAGLLEAMRKKTPLTRKELLKWAKAEAKRVPVRVVDDGTDQGKRKEVKNSAKAIVVEMLMTERFATWKTLSSTTLLYYLQEMVWFGQRAYKKLTLEEALAEAEKVFFDPDGPLGLTSFEDLVEWAELNCESGESQFP